VYQTPFSLHVIPILQFVVLSIFNTPINFLWQEWLEERFPTSTPPSSMNAPLLAATGERGYYGKSSADVVKDKAVEKRQTLNVRNILVKFLLDQTVGAVYNTVSFIAGMGLLKGLGRSEIIDAVKKVRFCPCSEFIPRRRRIVWIEANIKTSHFARSIWLLWEQLARAVYLQRSKYTNSCP